MEGNQEEFPDYAEELQKCKDFLAQYQVRVSWHEHQHSDLAARGHNLCATGLIGHLHSPNSRSRVSRGVSIDGCVSFLGS